MKKNVLEIQWDYNWGKEQRILYHLQIQVAKVRVFKDSFLRWALPIMRPGVVVWGKILSSDIDLQENEIALFLGSSNKHSIIKGDVLNLSISEKGWCIELKKEKLD